MLQQKWTVGGQNKTLKEGKYKQIDITAKWTVVGHNNSRQSVNSRKIGTNWTIWTIGGHNNSF